MRFKIDIYAKLPSQRFRVKPGKRCCKRYVVVLSELISTCSYNMLIINYNIMIVMETLNDKAPTKTPEPPILNFLKDWHCPFLRTHTTHLHRYSLINQLSYASH